MTRILALVFLLLSTHTYTHGCAAADNALPTQDFRRIVTHAIEQHSTICDDRIEHYQQKLALLTLEPAFNRLEDQNDYYQQNLLLMVRAKASFGSETAFYNNDQKNPEECLTHALTNRLGYAGKRAQHLFTGRHLPSTHPHTFGGTLQERFTSVNQYAASASLENYHMHNTIVLAILPEVSFSKLSPETLGLLFMSLDIRKIIEAKDANAALDRPMYPSAAPFLAEVGLVILRNVSQDSPSAVLRRPISTFDFPTPCKWQKHLEKTVAPMTEIAANSLRSMRNTNDIIDPEDEAFLTNLPIYPDWIPMTIKGPKRTKHKEGGLSENVLAALKARNAELLAHINRLDAVHLASKASSPAASVASTPGVTLPAPTSFPEPTPVGAAPVVTSSPSVVDDEETPFATTSSPSPVISEVDEICDAFQLKGNWAKQVTTLMDPLTQSFGYTDFRGLWLHMLGPKSFRLPGKPHEPLRWSDGRVFADYWNPHPENTFGKGWVSRLRDTLRTAVVKRLGERSPAASASARS